MSGVADDKRAPVPQWRLERYLTRELPPDELHALDARCLEDEHLRAQVEALREDDRLILQQYPPLLEVGTIRRKAAAPGSRPARARTAWIVIPALAAAALLVLVLRPPATESDAPSLVVPSEEPGTTRPKGLDPSLHLYRQIPVGEPERLADRAGAQAGDLIEVRYVAAGLGFGVIVSLDGRGAVTLHHPAVETGLTTLLPSGEHTVGFAYELDDAPEYERFFFVAAERPLEAAVVLNAARALAARGVESGRDGELTLPEGWRQDALTLRKVPR